MNVLADDIGRRPDLVIVKLVCFWHDIRVHILCAVESVDAQYERLRRTLLFDRRHNVLPQRDDALLREVVTELVKDRVELHVGGFIDAGRG